MLYNMANIYSFMGKRGPKSKFTDVVCPNEACKYHGVAGQGNIIGNGTYQARNTTVRRYICHSCGKAFCDSSHVKAGLLFPFLAGLLFPVWPVYFSSFDSLSFPKCERF
jgi:ribosomal protein S27E